MAFQRNSQYVQRLTYSPNTTVTYKFPAANIYGSMDLLLNLKVNIVTSTATNAPDFQIFNAIDTISLVRDSNQIVWSLSGQAAALLFTYDARFGGKAAIDNSTIAGTVANGVAGQHYLHMPFYPDDAPKPGEFGCDTRAHVYELSIKWKDLTAAGTLFGSIGGTITTTNSDNYVDIQLNKAILVPNPQTGAPDSLANASPLMVGIQEQRIAVTQTNSKFDISLPKFESYRKAVIYTTDQANTNQELGVDTVLNNDIQLMNSQNTVFNDVRANMLRQRTSQKLGQGSSMNAGRYDLDMLLYGSAMDVLTTGTVNDMFLRLDVNAQTDTFVRPIFITQEAQ